jgi:hypothetical protein
VVAGVEPKRFSGLADFHENQNKTPPYSGLVNQRGRYAHSGNVLSSLPTELHNLVEIWRGSDSVGTERWSSDVMAGLHLFFAADALFINSRERSPALSEEVQAVQQGWGQSWGWFNLNVP